MQSSCMLMQDYGWNFHPCDSGDGASEVT